MRAKTKQETLDYIRQCLDHGDYVSYEGGDMEPDILFLLNELDSKDREIADLKAQTILLKDEMLHYRGMYHDYKDGWHRGD